MLLRKRKDALWPEKSLTPKLLSSMNINVNAYILHCYDNATDSGMADHTEKISQTNSECCPQQHLVDWNEKTIFIDYCQSSNGYDPSFSTNLHFADYRSGSGHLSRGKSSF